MIPFSIALWVLLWLTAKPGEESFIKDSQFGIAAVDEVRRAFLNLIGFDPNDAQALVAGLSVGERSLLSDATAEQMRELSLTHLVAVSGANLAIVVGAVWFLLAHLGFGRHSRFSLGLFAMFGYVMLVGPESSVIRAATMAFFVTVGLWLGRGSSALHSLALAVSFLLILDPAIATDFGFSLSAIATAGLLVAAAPLFETLKRSMPEWLALGLAAAASAQIFTTPILLMLQPGLPLYAIVANLIVEPVVAPVTILGISAAVLAIPIPVVSAGLIWIAGLGTSWIVFVASTLSEWPLTRLHFVAAPAGAAIAAAAVVLIASYFTIQTRSLKRLALWCLAGTCSLGVILSIVDVVRSNAAHGNWSVLNCDVGQGDALLVRSSGVVALVDVGPDEQLLRGCLDSAGIRRVDLLIISHYDADHVAGIDGLAGIPVGLAVLPGFADDRPLADKVESRTAEWAEQVTTGQRGMKGKLGECDWETLEPSFSAAEASDSNDASLVALFGCPKLRILALGDLGEAGQLRLLASSKRALAGEVPLVVKVAHHGSADQARELYEWLSPDIALLSVGANRFGHPTERILRILASVGAKTLRTDLAGAVSVSWFDDSLSIATGGKLAQ